MASLIGFDKLGNIKYVHYLYNFFNCPLNDRNPSSHSILKLISIIQKRKNK